ncbi:MAG: hypothetical protein ACYC7E_00545 [Armatimonadota bacterium]
MQTATHTCGRLKMDTPLFTVGDGIKLGICLIAPIMLAILLGQFGVGNWLYTTLSRSPLDERVILIGLWVLECAIIAYVVWRTSERSWVTFAGGMLLALLGHLVIVGMIALSASLGNRSGTVRLSWLMIQLPAMIGAIWIVLVPLRKLLHAIAARIAEKNAKMHSTYFAFERPKERRVSLDYVTGMPRIMPVGVQRTRPPEGFQECAPAREVAGTVVVLREVILESVPEAEPYLPKDHTIRIPLAFLIPQIGRPTYWLTWRQAMVADVPPPGQKYPPLPGSPELDDRWVRLSCRHVLQQIPPEYFTRNKRLPAWALIPEIPQEAQLATPPRKGG